MDERYAELNEVAEILLESVENIRNYDGDISRLDALRLADFLEEMACVMNMVVDDLVSEEEEIEKILEGHLQ